MKLTLAIMEELQAITPKPKAKPQYSGCLTPAQLKLQDEIYKEAKLRKVSKRPAKLFNKYRPEF